jgi:DNA-binding transcriptional ArsR family regulator
MPNVAREHAAKVFRALGDPERLRLIQILAVDECSVSELAEVMGIRPNTLTQRLRVLRNSGLVERRRSGRQIFYRLADGSVADFVRRTFADAIDNSGPDERKTAGRVSCASESRPAP